eukprot:19847_1
MAILLSFVLTILWCIVPGLFAAAETCPHDTTLTIGHGTEMVRVKYCHSNTPSSTNARAVFAIHASGQKYVHSYHWIKKAAHISGLSSSMDSLMIIAPQFASVGKGKCNLNSHEACWTVWPYWSWGYDSKNTEGAKISSFEIMDKLITKIFSDHNNIKTAVVIGHSAGGQFVQRYALMNKLTDNMNKKIHFIGVNPSTYAYPNSKRWINSEFKRPTSTEQNACVKQLKGIEIKGTEYNNWPFGVTKDASDSEKGIYIQKKIGTNTEWNKVRTRYIKQRVTYIAGSVDVCPESGAINGLNCNFAKHYRNAPYGKEAEKLNGITGKILPANAVCFQGKNRMERAVNIVRSVQTINKKAKKTHKLILVPLVAHSLSNAIKHKHIADLIVKDSFTAGFNAAEDEYGNYDIYNENMGYDEYGYNNYDDGYDSENDEYIGHYDEYNYMDALNDLLEDELELEKKK